MDVSLSVHLEKAGCDGDVAIRRGNEERADTGNGGAGKRECELYEIGEEAGECGGNNADVPTRAGTAEGVGKCWVEIVAMDTNVNRRRAGSRAIDHDGRALDRACAAVWADRACEIHVDGRGSGSCRGWLGDDDVSALCERG